MDTGISDTGIGRPPVDNISPKILKACVPYVKTVLTDLYNFSIETATYPSNLKIAKVIALHKKNSVYLPENYRPISLLSCIDKIFEKLLHKRLMNFIDKHKIIILNHMNFWKNSMFFYLNNTWRANSVCIYSKL